MSVQNLCTDRRGSVTVEFIAITVVLLILLIFLTDLVIFQATVGKLDRTAYSVAGVLRERIQLFDGREELTQQDVDKASSLAQRMLSNMHGSNELSRLQLHVEEVHFKDPIGQGDLRKEIKMYKSWRSGAVEGACLPPEPLTNQLQLTPRGSYGRWVPLYQVTLCLPTTSLFSRWFSTEREPHLSSFAIVMLR